MPIDQFSKQQFEAALPIDKQSNQPLFKCEGVEKGEYIYAWEIKPNLKMVIRSSVKQAGVAAECGKDSIRIILASHDGNRWRYASSGSTVYTQRTPGWEKRLSEKIKELFYRVRKFEIPPRSFVSHSKSAHNPDRFFLKSIDGDFVRWLEEKKEVR
jgi:hypothetical protein